MTERIELEDGTVAHAEVRIGDLIVRVEQARGECGALPGCSHHHATDVDAALVRALAAGGTQIVAPADPFHGDPSAGLHHPNGNPWWLATRPQTLHPRN